MHLVRRIPPSLSQKVLLDPSRFVRCVSASSNARCRGISFAAAVPSPETKKTTRKRIPKDERRAMVQTFVNKYRAMNSGKFPTPTEAKNEVGGSYYVIRSIVKELEYECKMSSLKTKGDNTLQEKAVSFDDVSTGNTDELQIKDMTFKVIEAGEEVGISDFGEESQQTLIHAVESDSVTCKEVEVDLKEKITTEDEPKFDNLKPLAEQQQKVAEDSNIQHIEAELGPELSVAEDRPKPLDQQRLLTGTTPTSLADSTVQHHEAELGSETSTPVEKSLLSDTEFISEHHTRESHMQAMDAQHVLDSHPEKPINNLNEKVTSQNELKSDGWEPRAEVQRSSEIQNSTRELRNEKKDVVEDKEQPSVWKNFKSFADGIISFWRKL